jgi:hypothetical protein
MIPEEEIYKLYQLEKMGFKEKHNWDWLPRNPNLAFLVCLGAGPWKVHRRVKVQQDAMEWFTKNCYDLLEIPLNIKKPYPLDWQNNYLMNMVKSLKAQKKTFWFKCMTWSGIVNKELWKENLEEFFSMCGVGPEGKKCLWLFARDHLHLPAFPIDRHVERFLKEVGLKRNEWHIINMCHKAGLNPSEINRSLFLARAENHNFSRS